MSSLPPQEMKVLQALEAKLRLEQKNKEAAKVHLLAMQALLARAPIISPRPFSSQ